ncbi:MAG: glycoside hydrolase [Rudanella sp.]|nr:glycoside hydrolase [Rudanella sp.]
MNLNNCLRILFALSLTTGAAVQAQPIGSDTTIAYTMPLLAKTPTGAVMLTWTEKDAKGDGAFCMAQSDDKGKTFSPKQIVYAGSGVSGSRLMRPKVMFKKDGSMVAVFSNRADVDGKRTLQVMATSSTDKGMTWSAPKPVDSDLTPCVRGFFDAVMLPNDELAVAYLKDVAGSTKHEERNLRLVLTKNGVFQPERIIDEVVCDCCNVSLLVDANDALQVYYRDNNDDVRDMANMTSTDNGLTFSRPQILFTDNWKIAGCPHSGAASTTYGKSNLITWFSGTEADKGIRLVTQDGKRLVLANDPTARNGYVATQNQKAVFLWDQTNGNSPQIAYRTINGDKASAINWLNGSTNGINPSALVLDNQLLVAYEVRNANKKNGLKWSLVSLAAN